MSDDVDFYRAVELLGKRFDDRDRIDFLVLMLDHEKPGCRCNAVSALGSYNDPGIIAEIARRLPNENNSIVRSMILAYIRIKGKKPT